MPKTFAVEQTHHFHVSPGKVFAALTEPKLLVKWFLSEARLEPKKGGAFTFCWKAGYRMEGKVLEYSRGKSVSLLWVDKFPGRKVVKTSANFRVVSKGRGA
ncbi:MAG: SRPBCC domain-containing protein, partial [Thermoplasmata archaeon]|nr:SRPBCC domain-containing protein [Thermoplasmata archaeon]